jgi:hypothetical protein
MKTYTVEVKYSTTVTVEADSYEEAETKALDQVLPVGRSEWEALAQEEA